MVAEVETIDLFEGQTFRGNITIIREGEEYFCRYDDGHFSEVLNGYPFGSVKDCKEFVTDHRKDIFKINQLSSSIRNRINKFHTLQEQGLLPMKDFD